MDGIQINKLSLKQQVDSLFSDEDLVCMADGDLQGLSEHYFGNQYREALQYMFEKRDKILNSDDPRKYYRLYHKKRKEREYRLPIRLNYEKDADIIELLEQHSNNKVAFIRQVLREYVDKEKGANQ